MEEPLDLYKPPADGETISEEQKERVWQKIQMEVAKSEGLDEASYHILQARLVDSVGQSSDSFDGVGRGSRGELNAGRSKPVSRRRRRDVAPILAAAATVVVFAGGAWGMLSRQPGVQQWLGGVGKSTMNPPNTGRNGGNDTNNSSSQNPPNSNQNTTVEGPAGFTATSLTTNGVSAALLGALYPHSTLASPDGQWLAVQKPGQSGGTWLENMNGQMFKVSDKMLGIEASTPQGGVIMRSTVGGDPTVFAYNPGELGTPVKMYFPIASDKQSQLGVWSRESVSGNWLSRATEDYYTPGKMQKSWNYLNGQLDSKIPNFTDAAWSPVNGNVVAMLVPIGPRQISSAYEKFSLVTYNVKTQKEKTLSNGIVCDVEGGTTGLISWSPDGTKIDVLTRDGLGVLYVNAQGDPASQLMVAKSVYGLWVWLDGKTMLVMDNSTGQLSNKLNTYTWPAPNQEKHQAGPVLQGNIVAIQATGKGEAVVQTFDQGLWLVNSRQGIRGATGQFNSWWYDSANGKLYVVPQGSTRIFAKSLQGLLSTGGALHDALQRGVPRTV